MGRSLTFPATKKMRTETIRISDFYGVDYNDTAVRLERAAQMYNMIRKNDLLQTRPPLKVWYHNTGNDGDGRVHGIYEWYIRKIDKMVCVVHSGHNLHIVQMGEDGTWITSTVYEHRIDDASSMAAVLNNNLIIFDGSCPVILSQADNNFGYEINNLFYYDGVYIPRTSIGRNEIGEGIWFEAPNRATDFRYNDFQTSYTTMPVVTVRLDDKIKDGTTITGYYRSMLDGEWHETQTLNAAGDSVDVVLPGFGAQPMHSEIIDSQTHYTYLDITRLFEIKDNNNNYISFTINTDMNMILFDTPIPSTEDVYTYKLYFDIGLMSQEYTVLNTVGLRNEDGTQYTGFMFRYTGVSHIIGEDNIRVKFAVDMSSYRNELATCSIVTKYGYNTNMNRVFVSGNSTNPNVVLWSAVDDPTYWPEDCWSKVGETNVIGFSHTQDGLLGIHKRRQTDDICTYYMGSNLAVLVDKYQRTAEVFPIQSAVGAYELVNKYMTNTYLNDPCFLTNNGLYVLEQPESKNDERIAIEKSYYIRQKMSEIIKANPVALLEHDTLLFLFTDFEFYIGDKSTVSYSPDGVAQYDWYPCFSLATRDTQAKISSANTVWKKLFIGTDTGTLYIYDTESDDYFDGGKYQVDQDTLFFPIASSWLSQPITGGLFDYNKTLTNVYITYMPFAYYNKFDVNLITKDERIGQMQEWYSVRDSGITEIDEEHVTYNPYIREFSGAMEHRYAKNKTYHIRQRVRNFVDCQIGIQSLSHDSLYLRDREFMHTNFLNIKEIALEIQIAKKVR